MEWKRTGNVISIKGAQNRHMGNIRNKKKRETDNRQQTNKNTR